MIYAINAGGDAHTDIQGVVYKRDPLSNVAGISSDFGKQLSIQRVHPHDQILYQTERYHTQTFGYNIPIKDEGQYVIGKPAIVALVMAVTCGNRALMVTEGIFFSRGVCPIVSVPSH